jgi:hypothetical protein
MCLPTELIALMMHLAIGIDGDRAVPFDDAGEIDLVVLLDLREVDLELLVVSVVF